MLEKRAIDRPTDADADAREEDERDQAGAKRRVSKTETHQVR